MRLHGIAVPACPELAAGGVTVGGNSPGGAGGTDRDTLRMRGPEHQSWHGGPRPLAGPGAEPAGEPGLLRGSGGRAGPGRPARWLTASMLALGVLAAAAAAVSYSAQYRMVLAAKGTAPVAALEAGIPDVAALIFATLGIALALHGKRAIRPRVLNVGAVGTSIAMNVLAAGQGWRDLAIWVMPPVAYALASDTAIGVVRAWTIARQRELNEALADDAATPLALAGGLLLWLLRLTLAPTSTMSGFRDWVLDECPVAPGRRGRSTAKAEAATPIAATQARAIPPARPAWRRGPGQRRDTKTARFLALVADRYGPLSDFPLADVSRVCTELAPEVQLDPGAARTALRRHVQSLRNGSPR